MERHSSVLKIFNESSVEQDEISPSISIRRIRQLIDGSPRPCDLVYTENAWAAINNTLAGCAAFNEWQQAEQWILVTDEAYRGDAAVLLKGCESLASADASVVMIKPSHLSDTLRSSHSNTSSVVVLAVSADSVQNCVTQASASLKPNDYTDRDGAQTHLLWFPHDRAAQTQPINTALEALDWGTVTIICDLAKLSLKAESINESLVTMLRAAVFIDAQFLHWIEGNLSALADCDEELHRKAIMRAANALFTIKRRRSEEPAIPMAFTDTPANLFTRSASEQTPTWQVKAQQLLVDVRYAIAAGALSPTAAERILRVMTSLQLLNTEEDAAILVSDKSLPNFAPKPFLLLKDFGSAHFTREFDQSAWDSANNGMS